MLPGFPGDLRRILSGPTCKEVDICPYFKDTRNTQCLHHDCFVYFNPINALQTGLPPISASLLHLNRQVHQEAPSLTDYRRALRFCSVLCLRTFLKVCSLRRRSLIGYVRIPLMWPSRETAFLTNVRTKDVQGATFENMLRQKYFGEVEITRVEVVEDLSAGSGMSLVDVVYKVGRAYDRGPFGPLWWASCQ